MRVIGLLGEPATGKTAVMRAVLKRMGGSYSKFKFGLLRGRVYADERYVLGIYNDGELFAGTDRLSMAVQPYAIKFLKAIPSDATVIFEGDRLTREGFLMAIPYDSLHLFHLIASEREKDRRHRARGDTQPRSFMQSRRTLLSRILARFPATELPNEERSDIASNARRIAAFIGR